MVEKRGKFSALADLHRQPIEEGEDTSPPALPAAEPVAPSVPALPIATRAVGRPSGGKRSNPDWKMYSHYIKRKTQRAAVTRLMAEDSGRDLSDLLQELLENWLKTKPNG